MIDKLFHISYLVFLFGLTALIIGLIVPLMGGVLRLERMKDSILFIANYLLIFGLGMFSASIIMFMLTVLIGTIKLFI